MNEFEKNNEPIKCLNCNQPLYDDDALFCHFCGESLNRPSRGAMGTLRNKQLNIAAFVAVLVILSFVFLYVL